METPTRITTRSAAKKESPDIVKKTAVHSNQKCVALLGVAKLVLRLVLDSSLVKILDQFPVGVLGVLLVFDGIELAMCSRDMNSKEESVVILICIAISLVGSSAALGFLCGIFAS
ncbi:Molybdate transporter 2 [Abeliophyllum distichum]|uniref:Molybdate transporter 2 n=1 Tax=Abeliophyllum distichum TaxID=126358 RepID=A0ABD1TVF6_9LAMI